jgi:glycerol-3-phosphate dehydrogenase
MVLRKIMPDLLELNDGLFVAINEADLSFKERFLEACAACHIPAHDIPVKHALEMEPFLTPKTLAAECRTREVPLASYRLFYTL